MTGFRQARIAPGARAEQLTLAEFARLFAERENTHNPAVERQPASSDTSSWG